MEDNLDQALAVDVLAVDVLAAALRMDHQESSVSKNVRVDRV